MKYKIYITDSDKIFWTKNSVDKPTKNYFLSLMESIEWKELGNVTPNFINQFNGSITVDKDTYTYLKLVVYERNPTYPESPMEIKETKYFSVDSVSRVLSNGFVVDITLDVFTTYTLQKVYDSILDKPVKVNRTTALYPYTENISTTLLKDELISLPYAPSIYRRKGELYEFSMQNRSHDYGATGNTGTCTYELYNAYNNSQWERVGYSFEGIVNIYGLEIDVTQGKLYNVCLFDVYQDVNGDFCMVPVFGEWDEFSWSKRNWIKLNASYQVQFNPPEQRITCLQDNKHVNKIRDNNYWVNKYIGRYHIPSWTEIWRSVAGAIIIFTQSGYNNCIFMLRVKNKVNNLPIFLGGRQNPKVVSEFDLTKYGENKVNPNSNIINTYYLSKLTQFESEIPVFRFGTKNENNITYPDLSNVRLIINEGIYGEYKNFVFLPISGIKFFNSRIPYNCFLYGNESLPSNINSYNSYISSVQNQQNTSIQISKQQMGMGIFRSLYSGVSQGLNAIGQMGMNPMFAAGGMVNAVGSTISGVTSSIMQYQNTKRQIDAKNADALNSSTANNIVSSSDIGCINNSVIINEFLDAHITRFNFYMFEGLIANNPFNMINVQLLNKLTWETGYYINNHITFNERYKDWLKSWFDDKVNKFVYWDLEIPVEYIKFIYPNYNNELISAISTTINNPVRFWKQTPDYNCDLIIGCKYK